jgi:hypothetical protein
MQQHSTLGEALVNLGELRSQPVALLLELRDLGPDLARGQCAFGCEVDQAVLGG